MLFTNYWVTKASLSLPFLALFQVLFLSQEVSTILALLLCFPRPTSLPISAFTQFSGQGILHLLPVRALNMPSDHFSSPILRELPALSHE